WKLNSYSENLEGDKDILSIEYYAGKLNFLLDKYNSYNDKVRILKRTVPKKLHRFYKYTIRDVHFSYPKYKINNSLNGISIFLTHGSSSSYNLLQQALEKISLQQLPKDFPFEVTVVSNFIEKDIQGKLKEIWKNENQVSRLNIEILRILTHEKVRKLAAEKSRYEFLIFLNEADLLKPDYVRIAYKVLHERADFNLIGGRTSLARDVKPPKWFNSNKSFFGVGSPADESGDITNQNHPLLNAPVILRKKVLYNIYKEDLNSDQNEIASGYLDLNLTTKIKLYGGKIFYEKRLRSEKYIPVKFFDWSYLKEMHRNTGRLEVKESVYSHLFDGNNSNGNSGLLWIKKANNALGQINKYPLNKIFADKHEFAGDSEVLEIEKLKGKFSELLTSREKYHTFTNGNGKQIDEKVLLHINSNGNNNSKELKKGVSIVLCCYNSSKILPITLKYIFRQNIPKDIPWEIIIVDNASTDQTSETARNVYNTFNCLAPFTIVNEPKPGLSEARQRGFSTAKYEYVLFCDDDNLLEKNYVKYVYEVMNANKRIGVLGGQSIAEFDTSPQKWFEDWKSSFAIGKQFETDGDITWKRGYVWGASMVVRKEAWEKLRSKGFKTLLTDRKGKTLSAGGDTEICYALRNDGWKIWYDSRLKFKHHISLERLNWMYLRKLVRGFGQASAGLDFYLKNLPEKYSLKKRTKLNSKRIEIHKTLSTLRSIRHEKLLSFNRKREGDSDLPMIEYCLGRIEGLIKTRKTYNRGLKLLKRAVRKKDFIYISYAFKDYNINFPRYNVIKKLNGVSVIVCTYNGAERLAETIKKIAEQKVKANILWEVILVDNASTDDSKEITINEWKKYKTNAKLKIVDQPIPGKQLALEKGYEVAQYEYLITCDDDNWLDENFVQLTYEIMSSNEKIGALGGPNDPVCEIEPPEWFTYFKRDYAAGPQPDVHTGKISEGNITWKRGYVWGAGMIVRKSAWQQLFKDGFKTSMSCRKGSELSSGGDSEACYALVLAGWQIWYDSRLKLKHCMPAGRLDWNYLLRLFVGFGTATVGLEAYEKAIRLARADISESEILKQNWWYEFKKAITEIKKFGIKKILSLRFAQDNNTNILMLEFYISKLKELIRVRKDYDKSLESVRIASWKKDFSQLKADHRKYLEEQNDFRYGWPWINETEILPAPAKPYPKISILSPSFNSVGTIEKAILSVLNQGYPEFEHVICDA
ncbi:MAG: glycosyltransferase, partial [Ignavibacteria bacterium]